MNVSGFDLKVRIYLDEYIDGDDVPIIYVDIPINISVLGCEIKEVSTLAG